MAWREGRQARCLLAWRLRAPPWLRHPIPGWRALARLRRHAGAPLTKRLCVLGAARLFCGLSRPLRRAWRASAGASRRAGRRPRDGADARGGLRPCDRDNDSGLSRRRPSYNRFPHGRRHQNVKLLRPEHGWCACHSVGRRRLWDWRPHLFITHDSPSIVFFCGCAHVRIESSMRSSSSGVCVGQEQIFVI